MNGYEAAYSILSHDDPAQDRIMLDRFIFELNSAEGSRRKPRLSVEVHNGESLYNGPDEEEDGGKIEESVMALQPAPLSTAAVESLWDKIIPTIRARPNAF